MNKVLFVNVDFLDKKRKVNNGQMSKWLVENNHPAITSRKASLLIVNMDKQEEGKRYSQAQVPAFRLCLMWGMW